MEKPIKKTTKAPDRVDEDRGVRTLSVLFPFQRSAKYAQRDIYMTLRHEEAVVLRSILEGLEEQHAKTSNGKPVQTAQDALRWMLETVDRASR